MFAGTARIDITPKSSIWMDGMIRLHRSEGVHDPLFTRALVLSNTESLADAVVIVSIDVCALKDYMYNAIRTGIESRTGIPFGNQIIAGTHTHSGPSTCFGYNTVEKEYAQELIEMTVEAVEQAAKNICPALLGFQNGIEATISHYRRLLTDEGTVVMNWEPYPEEHIVGPLGEIDPDLGVLQVFSAENPKEVLCTLFNHTGHPNVMSGENYLFTADYPGEAMRIVQEKFGGMASFVNGALGSSDIDGLRDRDWEGVERLGRKLADAVIKTAQSISPDKDAVLHCAEITYHVPKRHFSDEELVWIAEELEKAKKQTGNLVTLDPEGVYGIEHPPVGPRMINPHADGVGNDLLAYYYTELIDSPEMVPFNQVCIAFGDVAFISFPGELFTEIGAQIKKESPFPHTYLINLANATVGYLPTRKAIKENSYEVRVRRVEDCAEDMVVENSLELLKRVRSAQMAGCK